MTARIAENISSWSVDWAFLIVISSTTPPRDPNDDDDEDEDEDPEPDEEPAVIREPDE